MIKYVELTPPENSAFRQATILSIECEEGSQIKEGDTLFMVQSGNQEVALPAAKSGKIEEMIAYVGQNISLSTALLLLETEVAGSTATKPEITNKSKASGAKKKKVVKKTTKKKTKKKATKKSSANKAKSKKASSKKTDAKKTAKKHEQQSLDLLGDDMGKMGLAPPVRTPKEITNPVRTPKKTTKKSNPMSSNLTQQITVPDIGTDQAKVVEIFVSIGDTVAKEDPLLMLESDKASMELPSTHAGTVSAISVEIDQDISEGMAVVELTVETANEAAAPLPAETEKQSVVENAAEEPSDSDSSAPPSNSQSSNSPQEVKVAIPDIGGDSAKVIEILVNVGDQVAKEDPLVTLESDKASMDVPSSADGVIESIDVEIDQDVGEGTIVVTLLSESASAGEAATNAPGQQEPSPETSVAAAPTQATQAAKTTPAPQVDAAVASSSSSASHASPSIRRFARELGADLSKINGSGRKGRISKDDVKAFVKGVLSGSRSTASEGAGIPQVPAQDFSKFGDIDIQPLNKIKRLTATNLHRSWLNVPHVTHSDESDITDLEAFRKQLNAENAKQENGVKLSPLAFIVKAVVRGLQAYPQFNSSLEPGGENLIFKKYFHIGIAVETPNGLVVPVVKDADQKSVGQIATEMGELAAKARDKKLTMADMSGACITISSLGGIGGTHFTPIVNAPEVAILGVSRSKVQPQWNGTEFVPATMLPLSLSYDHRVIDGAEAARFTRHVAAVLEDVRRLTI